MNSTRRSRPGRDEPLRERRTVHVGHDDIGEQQIDLVVVLIEDLARAARRRRLENAVALTPQHRADDDPDAVLVFDEQDRFAALVHDGGHWRRRRRARSPRRRENAS